MGAISSHAVSHQQRRPLVITTCASRKRRAPAINFQQLTRGDQNTVQEKWLGIVERAQPELPAERMYAGRAFGLSIRAASLFGAEIGVISAGLGYLRGQTKIPSYDLTLRAHAQGTVRDLVVGEFEPSDWWQSLQESRYSSSLSADAAGRPLVLICLSREYAKLAEADLQHLADSAANLRIFGLGIASGLPMSVAKYVLPYDERLGALGYKGTRIDFPQRALLHYVSHILPSSQDLAADVRSVKAALAGIDSVASCVRVRQSNEVIKQSIRELMQVFGGKKTKILQHLRYEQNVPCEQGRFSALYAEVKQETEGLR